MGSRRSKLSDAVRLQQLFRDIEDEEDWIREKEPIAASTNRGKADTSVVGWASFIEVAAAYCQY